MFSYHYHLMSRSSLWLVKNINPKPPESLSCLKLALRQRTSTQQALGMPYENWLKSGSRQAQQGLLIFPKTLTNISMKKPNTTTTLVVADTSGLMSLLVDTDANYEKALALSVLFDES